MKAEGSGSVHRWCRRRGLEQQRFYEITKLKEQFQEILLVCDKYFSYIIMLWYFSLPYSTLYTYMYYIRTCIQACIDKSMFVFWESQNGVLKSLFLTKLVARSNSENYVYHLNGLLLSFQKIIKSLNFWSREQSRLYSQNPKIYIYHVYFS